MNLMFWKKKADTGENAETTQENFSEEAVAQKMRAMGLPATESSDSGLSDLESADPETTEKPGLATRAKLLFATLIRRFKKTPAFQAEDDQAPDAPESPVFESEESSPAGSVNLKKRLIIGGAIGLLILLLVGTGFAVRKIFLSAHEEDIDAAVTVETPHAAQPVQSAQSAVIPLAEIEALKKKNDELQAQIKALKKEQLQPEAAEVPQASGNTSPTSENGTLTIDNKDPKATAMSLKEAIDAMNAGSGEFNKKPAK